jgi:hypothetical protein
MCRDDKGRCRDWFWIKNALDFPDSRCIVTTNRNVSEWWAFSYTYPQRQGDVLYELGCRAGRANRTVDLYDKVLGKVPVAHLPGAAYRQHP